MIITVHVSWQHIRCGTPGECDICPIALALRDALPRVSVSVTVTYPDRKATAYLDSVTVNLPEPCLEFMQAYDREEEALPFSFHLEVPRWLTVKH